MKEIKDYLHLYLGCECLQPFKDKGKTHVISIHTNGLVQVAHSTGSQDFWNIEYIKPILRPLSDMKKEEWQEVWGVIGGTPHLYEYGIDEVKEGLSKGDWSESGIVMDYYTMSCVLNYFRKINIDCDDLIPSGLAIDKTTIT